MEVIQNILIVILAGYMTVDQNGPVVLSWFSVIVGMISGLIMGDMNTGLMIGGTFQLMSLGVAALGGASAPNYGLATIIGTFIAVRTGTGVDAAIAVGLPVGLLAIQLEVVVRIILNFVAHKMQTDNNEGKWKTMNMEAWIGPILCSLQTIIPTVIVYGTAGESSWRDYLAFVQYRILVCKIKDVPDRIYVRNKVDHKFRKTSDSIYRGGIYHGLKRSRSADCYFCKNNDSFEF